MDFKVCGIKNNQDLLNLKGLDIDWVGVNISPISKRFVNQELALSLCKEIHSFGFKPVLVSFKQSKKQIDPILKETQNLSFKTYLQAYDFSLLKRLKLDDSLKILALKGAAIAPIGCKYPIIFDGGKPGSGIFEKRDLPIPLPGFLAGGIKLNNLKELIRFYKPQGIDSASGTENPAGNKCRETISRMIEIIRSY